MKSAIKTLETKLKDLEMFAALAGIITFAGEKIDVDEVVKEHKQAINLIKSTIEENKLIEKIQKIMDDKDSNIPDEVKQISKEYFSESKPNSNLDFLKNWDMKLKLKSEKLGSCRYNYFNIGNNHKFIYLDCYGKTIIF